MSVSTQVAIGPGTILIGSDQSQTFFVAPGTTNLNTNTHTETFVTNFLQAARTLSAQGVNFLLGDLHTAFQTTLLDGSFWFTGALLARGSQNGDGAGALFSPLPMAFAADAMGASAFDFDGALAFATKAPRVPMTVALGDGWRAWIRGTLGRATFDGTATNFGYRNRTASGEGGIERLVGDWLYGAAFGFGTAKVEQDRTGDSGRIDTLRAGAYAAYRPGPWSFTGTVTAGWSDIDSKRLTLFPTPATASYDATTIAAGFEAVRRYDVGAYRVEPLAGLVYTALRVDGFTETGSTFLDIRGDRATIDALQGYAGGRVSTTFAYGGADWTPELRGRVVYDFLDDPRGFTARFVADPANTPLPVTGIQPDRFAVMLGGAMTARLAAWLRAFASYDAELRGGDVSHLVSGGLRWNW
ncbi:autotransporter outer membrane beta-barrel domain-containing protein [Pseudorhodoplanes sp.]|uniref:autotransporter outer membrane beta-barrel domain-containing protein n=1 Tax=Pseudorhodoplanes sp. TaxID=1934341 RepID=UPI003D0FC678